MSDSPLALKDKSNQIIDRHCFPVCYVTHSLDTHTHTHTHTHTTHSPRSSSFVPCTHAFSRGRTQSDCRASFHAHFVSSRGVCRLPQPAMLGICNACGLCRGRGRLTFTALSTLIANSPNSRTIESVCADCHGTGTIDYGYSIPADRPRAERTAGHQSDTTASACTPLGRVLIGLRRPTSSIHTLQSQRAEAAARQCATPTQRSTRR